MNDNLYSLLIVRDTVIYPGMVLSLFVSRKKSILGLCYANEYNNKKIFVVSQIDIENNNPDVFDIYNIGTICVILQLVELQDGTIKVLLEGINVAFINNCLYETPFYIINVHILNLIIKKNVDIDNKIKVLFIYFEQYVKLNEKVSSDVINSMFYIDDPVKLVDNICTNMIIDVDVKQEILEIINFESKIYFLLNILENEIIILDLQKQISVNLKKQIDVSQKEYYLNEQIKLIQKELGKNYQQEIEDLRVLILKKSMTIEAKNKALLEINKLKIMPQMSAESTVARNYIDCLISLPWHKYNIINFSLNYADIMFRKNHYGLLDVKEKIIEYLAIQYRSKKIKGQILCLIGPPGVGKTSLGKTIAKVTKRQFIRMSLGGVYDEAEIRGHRRTYIGAMPGKILQNLSKIGVSNPLFLLDEIDKIDTNFRGDPSSALLEVLDQEQNDTFSDHYVEVDYDLSNVMFIVTANTYDIPTPLLDRMDIIKIDGYSEKEKLNIAINYLIPKLLKKYELNYDEVDISLYLILIIIRNYTLEAGVRELERQISALYRKVLKNILISRKKKKNVKLNKKSIVKYLGVEKYNNINIISNNGVGQILALAWTEYGGDVLSIETAIVSGIRGIINTGNLGKIMQESIFAAVTFIKSKSNVLCIDNNFNKNKEIHVHVPFGSIPKDGPSAGVAICCSIVSSLIGIPVKKNFALSGEMTITGKILPVGGLKEKILAAKRMNVDNIIVPSLNNKDICNILKDINENVNIYYVDHIEQVFSIIFDSSIYLLNYYKKNFYEII